MIFERNKASLNSFLLADMELEKKFDPADGPIFLAALGPWRCEKIKRPRFLPPQRGEELEVRGAVHAAAIPLTPQPLSPLGRGEPKSNLISIFSLLRSRRWNVQGLSLPAKRLLQLAILVLLFLPSDFLSQAMTPEVHQIGDRFACQCGNCNNQVSTCPMLNCHSATPLREEIAGMIKQGMKAEQIVSAFVAKYGKVILAAPPAEGFDLMAWTLPFIMLLFGFILVYWLINTWLIRKPALASSAGGRDAIPEGYQDRIDRELKDLDR